MSADPKSLFEKVAISEPGRALQTAYVPPWPRKAGPQVLRDSDKSPHEWRQNTNPFKKNNTEIGGFRGGLIRATNVIRVQKGMLSEVAAILRSVPSGGRWWDATALLSGLLVGFTSPAAPLDHQQL
ncbi:hypothetical protein cyc_03543 [Cyclospora cayetanensis]|uniref:Uncharacterized protein n=1 Tax=Cyclospora cayetanensis TaxID=88456 RepID=A0A1D3CW16_9EIME|nr:hypothetical protein cyc_03543 [Cyclospora cayetanensis]